MLRSVINLADEKLLRSYDRIGKAIVDYINDMGLTWEIEAARRTYFGKYIDIIDEGQTDLSYKPFIQWLIFSYKLHDGSSLIDCIYNTNIKRMNSYEKDALKSLTKTYESLYKVYTVEDNRVLVKDVFSNKMTYVWDSQLSKSIKRYWGIYMRIVSINNKNIPIPGYSIMSNSFLKDTEEYIMEIFKELNKFSGNTSLCEFLNSNSLLIHRYFLYFDI